MFTTQYPKETNSVQIMEGTKKRNLTTEFKLPSLKFMDFEVKFNEELRFFIV